MVGKRILHMENKLWKILYILMLLIIFVFVEDTHAREKLTTYDDRDVVYLLDNQAKIGVKNRIGRLFGGKAVQPVDKIYLQKTGDVYTLSMVFNENFSPRIHTLPTKMTVLLSFPKPIISPSMKNFKHRLINQLEFKKIGEKSLLINVSFSTNIVFIAKKYTARMMKISFKIIEKKKIIIDAGHGGTDPGAVGIGGVYEKNITLQFAKELRNLLDGTGRYNVIMVRQDDRTYPIDDRVADIAKVDADILISLHTDSNPVSEVHGMSVYTLPEILKGRDTTPEYMMNLRKSRDLARRIIGYIPKVCKIKKDPCRGVELKILKIAIPAILVEVGCLSNKIDHELLHLKEFRDKMNCAILYALDDFFKQRRK